MGGLDLGGRIGGVGLGGVGLEGSNWGGRIGGVGLGGFYWRDRTGGVGLEGRMGSDWGLPCSKENKAFFFRNYIKILSNLVNFSLPLQSPRGDVNTKMAFSTKCRVQNKGKIS